MKCELCGRECSTYRALGIHLGYSHKDISKEDYHNKYIKHNDGHCKRCGCMCHFLSLAKGYFTFCSHDCQVKSEEVQEKSRQTKFEHFGVGNYQSKEKLEHLSKVQKENKDIRRIKKEETCLTKYGVRAVLQHHYFLSKAHKRYLFDNEEFDSSWEMAYYAYLKDNHINFEYHPDIHFEYYRNNKVHIYHPDFIVEGKIVEIKGKYLMHGKYAMPIEKIECMYSNNISILMDDDMKPYVNYFKTKYGSYQEYKQS